MLCFLGEEAIEQLLELFPTTEETAVLPEKKPQSKFSLRAVAESWLKNTSSDSVPELAPTEALCSTSYNTQWTPPLSKDSHAFEKTLPISAPHSAACSEFAEVLKSGSLSDKRCISKLRDQQLDVPDLSVQNQVILGRRSLFVNDPTNLAANNNSLLLVKPPGSQGNFAYEPSLESLVGKDDIYFSDDDSDSTCDTAMQPAVNMNSDWSQWSNFVQPDGKVMTRNLPYFSGLEVGASRRVPLTSQGFSVEQSVKQTPASGNRYKDLSNMDFIMPRHPVKVRNSPTELRAMRLGSPVCSPQKPDAIQVMPQSIFTPRAMFNPTAGLMSSPLPMFNAKPERKVTSMTIMSAEAAKHKVLGLLQQNRKVMILMRGCPGSGKTSLAR